MKMEIFTKVNLGKDKNKEMDGIHGNQAALNIKESSKMT